MKLIIFIDRENFEGSLKLINRTIPRGKKRFWRLEKYTNYLFKKIQTEFNLQDKDLKLIKIFLYTGKYTSEVLYKFKRRCYEDIKKIGEIIESENTLLKEISKNDIGLEIKNKIKSHVERIKNIFQSQKKKIQNNIEKQKKNYAGQKGLFENIKSMPLIELKPTKLRQGGGRIFQKGVDVNLATDLVHLAHMDIYDVALVLGGDSDLKEAVKLVNKTLRKIVVVLSYYNPEDPLNSNTCPDLIKASTHFMNLKNFSEEDIIAMSDLMRMKEG